MGRDISNETCGAAQRENQVFDELSFDYTFSAMKDLSFPLLIAKTT